MSCGSWERYNLRSACRQLVEPQTGQQYLARQSGQYLRGLKTANGL